jgi:enolase-phosphatase E1
LWERGYKNGDLKGHVYPDVAPKLEEWKASGLSMGVFSSGSVAAQKLIFGYSVAGDLTPYFSAYFDTRTGGKRETETYRRIAAELQLPAWDILFLSDIKEELEAADAAGCQTVQLLRPGTAEAWPRTAKDFSEL